MFNQQEFAAYASGPVFKAEVVVALFVLPLWYIWRAKTRKTGYIIFYLSAIAWISLLVIAYVIKTRAGVPSSESIATAAPIAFFLIPFSWICLKKISGLPR